MQPATHHLTITDRDGKTIRGQVVYVKRIGTGVARVYIETQDVLKLGYDYDGTYATASQEAPGIYKVYSFRSTSNLLWPSIGIFTRAKEYKGK